MMSDKEEPMLNSFSFISSLITYHLSTFLTMSEPEISHRCPAWVRPYARARILPASEARSKICVGAIPAAEIRRAGKQRSDGELKTTPL